MAKPPPIELPPRYYLEYFEYLLGYMEQYYGEILSEEEKTFIHTYRALPQDAQCLAVRMANRRGEFFLLDSFRYEEIEDMLAARKTLAEAGLLVTPGTAQAPFFVELLSLFPKPFLYRMGKDLEVPVKSSWRKGEIVEALLEGAPYSEALAYMETFHDVVMCTYGSVVYMFRFLFFGNTYEDLTQFVIRDIGYVRYEQTRSDFTPLFANRKEAEDKLKAQEAYEYFKYLRDTEEAETVVDWYQSWIRNHLGTLSEAALAPFDKLTLRLGQWLERQEWLDEALEVYEHTQTDPGPERRIRLLHKLGRTEEAVEQAEHLTQHAESAEARIFAGDFLRKHQTEGQWLRRTTAKLKEAEEITISADFIKQVELGTAHHYSQQGFATAHTENALWRSFFGLLFWEEIFDDTAGAFHHPLQRMPSDLAGPGFLKPRRKALKAKMQLLYHREAFVAHVEGIFEAKQGTANAFTGWHPKTLDLVLEAHRLMEPAQWEAVLWEMARNPKVNSRGFPDLFLWKQADYLFVEVKSPNDHLGPQQWFWLEFFEQHGIAAKIVRVKWGE